MNNVYLGYPAPPAIMIRPLLTTEPAAGGGVGLLVSVRSTAEAEHALAGGAAIIDVKEPAAGPLGAAPESVIRDVVRCVAGRAPVTAALGELRLAESPVLPPGVEVAKVGLSGLRGSPWRALLRDLGSELPETACLAPVYYADANSARSPDWIELVEGAAALKVDWLVIDTWDKRGPSSFDLIGAERLRARIREAQSLGIRVVLAGGLSSDQLRDAAHLGCDYIGVRGAACDGGRSGSVQVDRVRSLARQIRAEHADP